MNSEEQGQNIENFVAGLLRQFPMSKDNALNYIRLGKKIADNGNILKTLAEQEIKKNLTLYQTEE